MKAASKTVRDAHCAVRVAHARARETFGFNHDPNDMYTAWSLGTTHCFLSVFDVSWTGVYWVFVNVAGAMLRNTGSLNNLVLVDYEMTPFV